MQQNARDPRRKGKIGRGSLCPSSSFSCPTLAAANPCRFGPLSHLSNQHPLVLPATSFAYRRIFPIRRTTARSARRKQFPIPLWARVHDDFVAGVDVDGFTAKGLTMENTAGGDLLFGHRPVRAGGGGTGWHDDTLRALAAAVLHFLPDRRHGGPSSSATPRPSSRTAPIRPRPRGSCSAAVSSTAQPSTWRRAKTRASHRNYLRRRREEYSITVAF